MLGVSATLGVAWLSMYPAHAVAAVEGPCTSTIDDVDVTRGHDDPDRAVRLRSGTEVAIAGTARSRVTDLSYTVHIAGGGVQVGSVVISQDGASWSGTVDLSAISNATVGVFEVTTDVATTGASCSATAYVCIEGRSPLTTVAGIGATVVGLGGAILLVLALTGARRSSMPRSSLQAFAGGAIAGLGGAVLLQQFCTTPLTATTALAVPVLVGGIGAIAAVILHGTGGGRGAAQPPDGHATTGPAQPVGPTDPADAPTQPVGVAGGYVGVDPERVGGPAPAPPVLLPPPPPAGEADAVRTMPVATAQDRTCPNCGTANEADAVFCTNCGERLA